ncbi:MAG: carboxymuconolactone decarboxylase family protein [Actinomycetota bacterium]
MTDTPRLAPLADDELEGAALELMQPMIDSGRPWNIFRTLAHHPDLARRWLVFANHVLFKSTLSPRHRELAILRVGWRCGSEYEFAQHRVIGLDAGLTRDEVEQVKRGPTADGWSDLDRLVLVATDELHEAKIVSDETWSALGEHLSDHQRMDLVFAVGQYTLVSMALRTFGVPLDDFLEGF